MAENIPQEPSLVQGHVQYAKGIAEAAVGDMTGSHPWKSSGEQDKAAGISAMKTAGERRDASQGYGKPEELAGKLTGCEGMKKEGSESSSRKH
ncbi:hypothetical protein X797_010895 [Metarhizium robertsii]|uniref:Uncharacterized protein n=2 Tax=Metarhizium robertsii TaxID=568076 RepID=E9F8W0_METRA|nr:uncharacterized protein MAA_08709 [Metarhizium robertsii ARSEF 23]EFY95901.1 hypothetical protein MAA_08709 [Metarhizium robertsii ARSEF 23]EXU96001.1 hypothetical protein X797_010895 [Metarhizium robertsii]